MMQDDGRSLGDGATFAGDARRPRADASLSDERTLGGGDAAGIDTILDDIEVVDIESRYRIEGPLGRGGMGAVLLATDTRLGRKVAIKRILGDAARNKTAVMRFLTEAQALAALDHASIVKIYDYGRAKDGPFLIMEFVDGGSLADRCKQGALPVEEAVELACQLCDALAKAHDAGIVHRDIKPANVLLNGDGQPKLTDFGLAKAGAADHGMTMTGAVMGTPDFMPPEQREDAALVDHRSDLWSLAATVYQMVTGRSPKIIRFNDVPAALQDVLAKALEEAKEARYQSAREFRDALRGTVRVAATAPTDMVAGQCVECGVVNEVSRNFCASCGASLHVPCLSCGAAMGSWERICDACGGNQPELLSAKEAELSRRQAGAEGFLEELRFDEAAALLAGDDANDRRFRAFAAWKQGFAARLERARHSEWERTAALVAEALRHEAAFDYKSAVQSLERVAPSLRDSRGDDAAESAGEVLARVKQKRATAKHLDKVVRDALNERNYEGLLPRVTQLLELCPQRTDVARIKRKLEERDAKLAAQATSVVGRARELVDAGQNDAAIESLDRSGLAGKNREVDALLEYLRTLQSRERDRARDFATLKATVEDAMQARRYGTARQSLETFLANAAPGTPFCVEAGQILEKCNREWRRTAGRMWLWTGVSFLGSFFGGVIGAAVLGIIAMSVIGQKGGMIVNLFAFFGAIAITIAVTLRNTDRIQRLRS